MDYLENTKKHFATITTHRHEVMKNCFRAGIGFQGLFHDLSKYGPTEFIQGVLYYQGDRSPNEAAREDYGYSKAWLHHKGRNKHHYEYWNDYDAKTGKLVGVKMPVNYFVEMVCDRVAASKVYLGADYTDAAPLMYFHKGGPNAPLARLMHPDTAKELDKVLLLLANKGEKKMFRYLRRMMRRYRRARMRHVIRRINDFIDSKELTV